MTTLMDRARLWLANTPEAHGIPYDSMHEAKGADLVRDLLAALSPVPPHSDEIAQLRALRDAVLELARTWEHEAEEIDQDGDFCCAHTRRNDAGALVDLLRAVSPAALPPTEPEK